MKPAAGGGAGAGNVAAVLGDLRLHQYDVQQGAAPPCNYCLTIVRQTSNKINQKIAKNSTSTLLLAGVAVGHLFTGLVSLLKYMANEDQLPDLIFWSMGSVSNVTWTQIAIMLAAAVLGLIVMTRYAWDLNVMATGEESAIGLGVNYRKIRTIAFLLSTLMTGVAVSFTGIIGFVGMVAPHIARIIVGNDYRYTIPTASVCGALLLLVADSISRVLVSTVSMPIGVVTSLIGVPFFLWLIVRKKQEV